MKAARFVVLFLGLALIASAIACDSDSPTSPGSSQGPGMSSGYGMGTISSGALDSEALSAMDRAIQDEYHAEQIYLGVLEDFGNVIPFANVVYAEARHSESIAGLYMNHDMSVPASMWNSGNVPRFDSIPAACAAAVTAEEDNIRMYDEVLRMELPLDVERVFTNNRLASLENHLPAFRVCAGF